MNWFMKSKSAMLYFAQHPLSWDQQMQRSESITEAKAASPQLGVS